MMTCTPEDALLPLLTGVVTNGPGVWKAICPCHDDHSPSLSVKQSDKGGLLLYCHVCKDKDIDQRVCDALNIKLADICPPRDTSVTSTANVSTRGVPPLVNGCKLVKTYVYQNEDGSLNRLVARYEGVVKGERAKTFRQFRPDGNGGWQAGMGKDAPNTLYRLQELLAAPLDQPVYIAEGEKAVDQLVKLGLVATCNHGGANGWTNELARFFDDRDVVVLPDLDEQGSDHAAKVARSLRGHARLVRIVNLPDLPPKGDIVDWVADGNTLDDLLRVVNEQTDLRVETPKPEEKTESNPKNDPPPESGKQVRIEPWTPFPVDVLPEPLRGFIVESARAIGCDVAYVALPALVATAAAIGLTYTMRMKNNWFVKPILWGCVVAKSGTSKTPAFDTAMQFTQGRQADARQRFAADMNQWERDCERFEKEHEAWEDAGGSEEDEPQQPPKPILERVVTTNITIEALASILGFSPKGIIAAVDELSGLIASFDRYSNGKGGDAPQWLSCYNAGPIVIDRKTGEPRTIYVPYAGVWIAGTTQPATLFRVMGREHRDSGLMARFLLVAPPSEPSVWSDDDIDEDTLDSMRELFGKLFDLKFAVDDHGKPTPHIVHKSVEAHREWVAFYNAHNERIADTHDEDIRASMKKLEEVAARISLALHVVKLVSDQDGSVDPKHIDGDTMRAGIALAQWFTDETRRVYQIVGGESPATSDRRRLLDWIAKRGGAVTVRDVYTGCRALKDPDTAEKALNGLVSAGLGEWREQSTGSRGGRPTRHFTLSASAKPQNPRGLDSCADADTADVSADAVGMECPF
jgi:hypothetical protein